MASQTSIRRNMGGMDYDSAPEYVDSNDYRDALNVRGQSDEAGRNRIEIIKGAEVGNPSFIIPPTVGSSKQYVISDIDGVSSYQLKLLYSNRSTMTTTATFNTPAQLITQLGLWFVAPQYVNGRPLLQHRLHLVSKLKNLQRLITDLNSLYRV